MGPGLPLILTPSGPNTGGPETLLLVRFLISPEGGGIKEGVGVPSAVGVSAAVVSGALVSPLLLAATGWLFESADDEFFDGDSSLRDTPATFLRLLGVSFKVTILVFMDFRRGAGVADVDLFAFVEAIVMDIEDERVKDESDQVVDLRKFEYRANEGGSSNIWRCH